MGHSGQAPTTVGHVPIPGTGEAATPGWMLTSTKPLEAALRGIGQEHIGPAATLWPFGQDSDTATRAGRYLPDTRRRPQRTRAALAGYVIARYSRPGQVVFDCFVGSGTTMVEAVYAGRHAVGVDQDVRWVGLTARNLTFAHERGATGNALVLWADSRELSPIPRRLRHRVDQVLATPPLQFKPNDLTGQADDAASSPRWNGTCTARSAAGYPCCTWVPRWCSPTGSCPLWATCSTRAQPSPQPPDAPP